MSDAKRPRRRLTHYHVVDKADHTGCGAIYHVDRVATDREKITCPKCRAVLARLSPKAPRVLRRRGSSAAVTHASASAAAMEAREDAAPVISPPEPPAEPAPEPEPEPDAPLYGPVFGGPGSPVEAARARGWPDASIWQRAQEIADPAERVGVEEYYAARLADLEREARAAWSNRDHVHSPHAAARGVAIKWGMTADGAERLVQKLRAERDAAYELEKAKADAEAKAYMAKWQREREEANAEALRRSQDKRGIAKEARERREEERRKREEAYAAANPFVMADTSRPRREVPKISGPDWRQGGRTVLLTLKGAPWKSNGHVALSDAALASPAGLSTSKAIAESQTKQPTVDKGARRDEMMRGELVAFRDTRRAIVDTVGTRKKLQGVYRSDSGTIRRVDLGYDPPETLYSVDKDDSSPLFDAPTVDAVRYMVMPMRLDGAEEKRLRAALGEEAPAANARRDTLRREA